MSRYQNAFLIISSLLSISCSQLYFGIKNPTNLSMPHPNLLHQEVESWEDAERTNGKRNEFEWWYFDSQLDDGSVIVAYFWKIHFLTDQYFIGFNYTDSIGENFFKIKYFSKKNIKISKDSCDVVMGNNYIKGNLKNYEIKLDPNDFSGIGMTVNLESTVKPYRPQDGIIKAGDDYFAWLSSVPNGKVTGHLKYNSKIKKINGNGYHDHNWGNTPLQKLFDGWTWFRGNVNDKTIIAASLDLRQNRGGYQVPILFIGDENRHILSKFGNDGLFIKKNNLIKASFIKNNEALFSDFDLLTTDGTSVLIHSNRLLKKHNLFKLMRVPFYIRWAFSLNGIDPHYIRYETEVSLNDSSGTGILEIMDLR